MAALSESTPVKLGMVATLILLIVGAVVQFTRYQAAVDRHSDDIAELKKSRDVSIETGRVNELRIQRLEDNYSNIMTSLGEVKAGVEEIKRKK